MKCNFCCNEAKNELPDTFTDLDSLQSKFFCDDCINLFSGEWLKTAFYWTEKEKKAVKQGDFEHILHNLEFPCLLSFSESRKKHRLFRSKWSYRPQEVYISTDTGDVCLNLDLDLPLFDYLQDFYRNNNISKDWLLNGFPTNAIKKIGLDKFFELSKKIHGYKGTQKYSLLISFLNK